MGSGQCSEQPGGRWAVLGTAGWAVGSARNSRVGGGQCSEQPGGWWAVLGTASLIGFYSLLLLLLLSSSSSSSIRVKLYKVIQLN